MLVQRMRLTNTKNGSYKFYQVDICYNKLCDEYYLDTVWGPIGKPVGQQVKKQHADLDVIIAAMEQILVKKLFKRGYEMQDIKRDPGSARVEDQSRFINEDWD